MCLATPQSRPSPLAAGSSGGSLRRSGGRPRVQPARDRILRASGYIVGVIEPPGGDTVSRARYTVQPSLGPVMSYAVRCIIWLVPGFLFLFGLLAGELAEAALVGPTTRPVLLVKETVDGTGVIAVTGQLGGLGLGTNGFGLTAGVQTLPLDQPGRWPLPRMPPLSVPAGADLTSATALASQWVAENITAVEQAFSRYERQYGISSAWLLYQQAVTVGSSTGSASFQVTWTLSIDASGRGSYGVPHLQPMTGNDQRILYVQYAAKEVPAGLSSAYANANGGIVRWQLLNGSLTSLTGPGTSGSMDVSGEFDPTLGSDASNQSGLSCLISASNSGCVDVGTDVARLLAFTGAVFALMDYTWPPEPQYTTVNDTMCPSGSVGGCDGVVGTYYYTRRELTYSNCGQQATYYNDGAYSLNVSALLDRYIVDPRTLAPQQIEEVTLPVPTQAAPFSWAMTVHATQFPTLTADGSTTIINPLDGSALMDANLLGEVALIPLTQDAQLDCPPMLTLSIAPPSIVVGGPVTTATASGGVPPYSYSWSLSGVNCPGQSDVSDLFGITNPTEPTTAVMGGCSSIYAGGENPVATLKCVATDSIGQTASGFVTVYQTGQSF